jgi:hypothetical protein
MSSADPEGVEFPLAPVSGALLVVTLILFALPAAFLVVGVAAGSLPLVVIAMFLLLAYAAVWLWDGS